MDHRMSVKIQAAEKYLLGELPPAERDAFERHYFECPECAEEVRLAFAFADNVTAVFDDSPAPVAKVVGPEPMRSWFAWMPPATIVPEMVCLALVVFTCYQNAVVIPRLRTLAAESSTAQMLPSAVLFPSIRGTLPSVSVPVAARFFQLSLEITSTERFERYECDLRSGSGKSIQKLPVSVLDPDRTLNLLVPAGNFPAGSYGVALLGVTAGETKELDYYPFSIRR
jgi:hypothetical protein